MLKDYKHVSKIFFAIVLGIGTLFIPFFVIKIILALIAIILFASSLKKFGVFLVIMAILFFLVPASIINLVNVNWKHNFPFYMNPFGNTFDYYGNNNYNSNFNFNYPEISRRKLNADIEISPRGNLYIEGEGIEIIFENNYSKIKIPSQIKYNSSENKLELKAFSNIKNETVEVIIGSDFVYDNIFINGVAMKISGDIKAQKKIEIESNGAIDFNGKIKSEEFSIRSTALNFTGHVDSRKSFFRGTAISSKITVENIEELTFNTTMADIRVDYKDNWTGKRTFNVSAAGGNVDLKIPTKSQDNLIVNLNGFINFKKKLY